MSWTDLTTFLSDYAVPLLAVAGVMGMALLLVMIVWVKRTGRPLRPMALAASMNLALMLNAEGMWRIAVGDLALPPLFAVLVFAVFEICFLTATSIAADQYRSSTVYGPDGKVITPGDTGPMLHVAAVIAVMSGVVVASNAHTTTEQILRLAIPCIIFFMWWAALTAAGRRVRRGRFAHSPRRIAERRGWIIPDDDPDLDRMAAERRLHKMTMLAHRLHNTPLTPKQKTRTSTKLALLSLAATPEEFLEVQRRVGQAGQVERLTDPAVLAALIPAAAAAPAVPTSTSSSPVEPDAGQRDDAAVSTVAPAAGGRHAARKAVKPADTTVVDTPATVKFYEQWLTIWQAMQADPDAKNEELADRLSVAPRTISKIRKAGKDGLLTAERLQELRVKEGTAPAAEADTGQVTSAGPPVPTVPAQSSRSAGTVAVVSTDTGAAAVARDQDDREPALAG
ncbi:hypothetical protein EV385_6755 [Krasilnikovia cinnamomea]|uniref:Uncharacterized protein n=1 Tax=Krasilnikovia cinnamomea TaxID=349313 RepID=A0A4Q7Z8A0_9ACTN|nr:hypothetical protein [Krasilnikovia cinnamomea]RZU46678.1 hypothetical protein EV385_6755 [Krasilnikovia cinnamomea]